MFKRLWIILKLVAYHSKWPIFFCCETVTVCWSILFFCATLDGRLGESARIISYTPNWILKWSSPASSHNHSTVSLLAFFLYDQRASSTHTYTSDSVVVVVAFTVFFFWLRLQLSRRRSLVHLVRHHYHHHKQTSHWKDQPPSLSSSPSSSSYKATHCCHATNLHHHHQQQHNLWAELDCTVHPIELGLTNIFSRSIARAHCNWAIRCNRSFCLRIHFWF